MLKGEEWNETGRKIDGKEFHREKGNRKRRKGRE